MSTISWQEITKDFLKVQRQLWRKNLLIDIIGAGSTVTCLNNGFFISPSELLVRGVIFFHSEWYLHCDIALLHMTEGGAAIISAENLSSLGVMSSTLGDSFTFISFHTSSTWVNTDTSAVVALGTSINWRHVTPRLTILSNLNLFLTWNLEHLEVHMLSLELRLAIAHIETDRSVVPWQSPRKLLSVCFFSSSPQTHIIHLLSLSW